MKRALALVLALLASSAAWGAEKLRDVRWRDVELPAGAELTPEGDLHLRSSARGGVTVTLVEIVDPGITRDRYAVEGRVRYEGVSGEGYLEMWSVFGPEDSYFTRTLAPSGPMQHLSGSSPWRPFGLPFDASGAKAPPGKLIVNLVLPGEGEVWISPMTLSQLDASERPPGGSGAAIALSRWGGLAGGLLGLAGAVFGWLGGRARAKRFVLGGLRTMVVAGAIALGLGAVALVRGAGFQTAFVLLLLGVVAVVAPLSVLPSLKKRYEHVELRRMRALDA